MPSLLLVERSEKLKLWESAVLVTNTDYPLETMIATIRTGLDHVVANAPQSPKADRWPTLVRYIVDKIIAARPKNSPPLGAPPLCLASGVG